MVVRGDVGTRGVVRVRDGQGVMLAHGGWSGVGRGQGVMLVQGS